jgi:hypothetical protein
MTDAATNRSLLFLSHATPEDNEFTRWLAAQLTIAGYKVWFDLDYLRGGDYFWSKVEGVIRHDAIRVVAVVSKTSVAKDGVRNEWDLAVTLEKKIPGFLIPVRIDDLDFSLLPITIHRKNVIDFHAGWHLGLRSLLDTLSDAKLPVATAADLSAAQKWLLTSDFTIKRTEQPETLDSNWLPIISLPPALETLEICSSQRQIAVTPENNQIPWFELGDHIVSFAPRPVVIEMFKTSVPLRSLSSIDTASFITAGSGNGVQRIEPFDARNRVAFLIRQAWDRAMSEAGLASYELANKRLSWYVPDGLVPKNKIAFVEASGKTRRKQLVGRSEKYKVTWHYGVSAYPTLAEPRRVELRAHIIFTEEDGKPVEPKRMHKLRRSFCKNWWNDRWRGFLKAYVALLAQGADTISLNVGGGRSIKVGASSLALIAPVGLSDGTELIEDEEISLDASDLSDASEGGDDAEDDIDDEMNE